MLQARVELALPTDIFIPFGILSS